MLWLQLTQQPLGPGDAALWGHPPLTQPKHDSLARLQDSLIQHMQVCGLIRDAGQQRGVCQGDLLAED